MVVVAGTVLLPLYQPTLPSNCCPCSNAGGKVDGGGGRYRARFKPLVMKGSGLDRTSEPIADASQIVTLLLMTLAVTSRH